MEKSQLTIRSVKEESARTMLFWALWLTGICFAIFFIGLIAYSRFFTVEPWTVVISLGSVLASGFIGCTTAFIVGWNSRTRQIKCLVENKNGLIELKENYQNIILPEHEEMFKEILEEMEKVFQTNHASFTSKSDEHVKCFIEMKKELDEEMNKILLIDHPLLVETVKMWIELNNSFTDNFLDSLLSLVEGGKNAETVLKANHEKFIEETNNAKKESQERSNKVLEEMSQEIQTVEDFCMKHYGVAI